MAVNAPGSSLLLWMVCALLVFAQETETIRVTTRMVHVSVIVQNAQGQAIRGLTRDDFRILDNGVSQQIRSFSAEGSYERQPRLVPGTFTNERTGPQTVTVIILDQLNCAMEDENYARSQLLKFLRSAEPRHRIALLSLSSELRILHELTTDGQSLARTLEQFLPGRNLYAAAIRPEPIAGFERLDAQVDGAKARERAKQTAEASRALARYLRRIPGRKNLVWMSSTFPGSLAARVREDDVAIYPIDIRGIKAPEPGLIPQGPVLDGLIYGAKALAAETGGLPFYGSNDLRQALQQAHEDSSAAYLLGYYPSHGVWDGEYRRIRVTVARPELVTRHRLGYFAYPENPEPTPRGRHAAILEVASAPDDMQAIRLRVEVNETGGGPRTVVAFVDPRTLSIRQKNGRRQAELEFAVVGQKENGDSYPGRVETYKIDVAEEIYRELILKQGISLTSRLTPPAATYRLRVVVRDVETGASGSVTVPMR